MRRCERHSVKFWRREERGYGRRSQRLAAHPAGLGECRGHRAVIAEAGSGGEEIGGSSQRKLGDCDEFGGSLVGASDEGLVAGGMGDGEAGDGDMAS